MRAPGAGQLSTYSNEGFMLSIKLDEQLKTAGYPEPPSLSNMVDNLGFFFYSHPVLENKNCIHKKKQVLLLEMNTLTSLSLLDYRV